MADLTSEEDLFRRILLWAVSYESQKAIEEDYPPELRTLRIRLSTAFPICTAQHVEGLLPPKQSKSWCVDFAAHRAFIYLPPTSDRGPVLPVIAIECDFRKDPVRVGLRLGWFAIEDNDPIAVGLRFECPEDAEGTHSYYHAQPITSFDRDGGHGLPVNGLWLPTKMPTIPVDARNSVQLLICALLSVYGLTLFESMRGQAFVARLGGLLAKAAFPHWRYTTPARVAAATAIGRVRPPKRKPASRRRRP